MLSVAILGIAAVYVLIYGTVQRSIVQVRDAVEHPHYVPETTQATYDQTLTHRPVPKPADPHQTCVQQSVEMQYSRPYEEIAKEPWYTRPKTVLDGQSIQDLMSEGCTNNNNNAESNFKEH